MVQIIELGKHPTMRLAETLGESLGKGLGEFATDYYSNKAIDKVLNDPSLKDADASKRLGALERALSPFGEAGAQMFQRRMGLEQMEAQEKEQKRQRALEAKTQKGYEDFANKLRDRYPNDPVYQNLADIYSSDIPADQKKAAAQALTGVDPFKLAQQNRLAIDTQSKLLSKNIATIEKQLENTHSRDKRAPLEAKLTGYQRQLDNLLRFGQINEPADDIDLDEDTQFEEIAPGLPTAQSNTPVPQSSPKPKFDPNNPAQQELAKALMNAYGDKEKVREHLRQSYDL